MQKNWFKNYPPGVPAEIHPDAYHSLVDMFLQSCAQYKKLPAFHSLGMTFTFEQLDRHTQEIAAYFQQILKLKKGDRLAIMLPNILQYPIAMFGALRAGLIVVNVNPLYTVPELVHQLNDAGAEAIIVLANFAHTVQQALASTQLKHIIITQLGDCFAQPKRFLINFLLQYVKKKIPAFTLPTAIPFKIALAIGKKQLFKPVEITPQDIAFLQYTGGTTGVAKGAMLTHRNLIANVLQAEAWFSQLFTSGEEIMIAALPLYHIFSLMASCLLMPKLGILSVLIINPRDLPHMIAEMAKFKFTIIIGVNTLFSGLLKSSSFAKLDFSHMKISLGGGMAVQRAVAEKWYKITGVPILEAYGLTETSPCVSINPANLKQYNGTIGLPVPSTQVAILDEEGQELSNGESGELAVKGPQVMAGYWQNSMETEKVFNQDGWLLTGDVASIDDQGYITLRERKKDMILVSGFNVYPNEVEDVIAQLAGVREVAVVGVPSDTSGEMVKAYVVKEDSDLTVDTILHHCQQNLTAYKIPRQIEFANELPKSNVGKILRRLLRDK